MIRLVSIRPETQREMQIVRSLGADNWAALSEREDVPCLKGATGLLIEKNGHQRWIRATQATPLDWRARMENKT